MVLYIVYCSRWEVEACKQNSKHFWKYVKSKTTNKEPISDLKYADSRGNVHVASTDDSKAEALCNFFSSVFNNEDDNPFKYLEKNTVNSLLSALHLKLTTAETDL